MCPRLLAPVRELLKHSNVDVRIEAGELIAHIFELGRDYDEEFDSQVAYMCVGICFNIMDFNIIYFKNNT